MNSGERLYKIFNTIKSKKIVDFFNDGFSGMNIALKILYDSGSPLSAGQISDSLDISTARVAVLLSNLENKGLILKSKSNTDARVTIVNLTNEGRKLIEERREKLFNRLEQILSKLNSKEQKQLFGLLQKILED